MTEAVIVGFECVDIAQRSAVPMPVARSPPQQRLEVLLEAQPVGGGSEGVGTRRSILACEVESQRERVGLAGMLHDPRPPGGVQSRTELREVERLRDVLVGPGAQSFDQARLVVPSS